MLPTRGCHHPPKKDNIQKIDRKYDVCNEWEKIKYSIKIQAGKHDYLQYFVWSSRRSPNVPGNCKERVPSGMKVICVRDLRAGQNCNLMSGVRWQGAGVRDPVSGVKHQVSGIRSQVSGVWCQGSGVRCKASRVR